MMRKQSARPALRMSLLALGLAAALLGGPSDASAMASRLNISGPLPAATSIDIEFQAGPTCTFPLTSPVTVTGPADAATQTTLLIAAIGAGSGSCQVFDSTTTSVDLFCGEGAVCCVDDRAGVQQELSPSAVMHGGAVTWFKTDLSENNVPALSAQGVILFLVLAGLAIFVQRQRRHNLTRG